MRENNIGGKIACGGLRKPPNEMEIYDKLPKYLREIVRNCPLQASSASIKNRRYKDKMSAEQIRLRLLKQVAESTLLTYGPDHPQAEKPS